MSKPENPSAFPVNTENASNPGAYEPDPGMTLRDYFAIHAPSPDDELVKLHAAQDRNRNPHNDSYRPRIRSKAEIISDLRYEFADAMLAARTGGAA